MSPDEESNVAPQEPVAGKPLQPRRRSRRGGRRRSPHRTQMMPVAQPVSDEPLAASDAGVTPAEREPERRVEHKPAGSPIRRAMDQVTDIIEELKRVLNEMEEVLETIELAERQKIDDEREIDSLQRALRQLHRPSSTGLRHP